MDDDLQVILQRYAPDLRTPDDEAEPHETCAECGALVQDDSAAVERECWRCGEAL